MEIQLKERFNAMISSLKANPNIRIVFSEVSNGLSEEEILKCFNEYSFKYKADIGNLYKQMNGFELLWIHVKNPHYNKAEFDKIVNGNGLTMEAMEACDGFISIEYLKNVLKPSMALGTIRDEMYDGKMEEFMGRKYEGSLLREKVVPFDYFEFVEPNLVMTMYLGGDTDSVVFMPEDDYADFSNSRYLSLASYLEFLIWSNGFKKARYDFFKQPEGYNNQMESLNKAYFDSLPPVDIDNLY